MRLFLSSIVLALPLISLAAEVNESVERSGSAGVTERALIVRSDESPVREVLLVLAVAMAISACAIHRHHQRRCPVSQGHCVGCW